MQHCPLEEGLRNCMSLTFYLSSVSSLINAMLKGNIHVYIPQFNRCIFPFTHKTDPHKHPLCCKLIVPLATMSMPPLWSRSPEKFPWMPSALAWEQQRNRRSDVSVSISFCFCRIYIMNHEVMIWYGVPLYLWGYISYFLPQSSRNQT